MDIKYRNPIPQGFDAGSLIRWALHQKSKTQAYLAKRTDRSSTTVMDMLKRKSVQASFIHEASVALEVDLFHYLSNNLPAHIRIDPRKQEIEALHAEQKRMADELTATRKEADRLEEDNRYLKKMIDILAKGR